MKYLRHPTLSVVPFDHTTLPKCLGCCNIIPVGELEEHLATCTLLGAYHRHVDPLFIIMQEQIDNSSDHDEGSKASKSDLPKPSKILSLPGPQNIAPLLNTIAGTATATAPQAPKRTVPWDDYFSRYDTFHMDFFGQWYNEDGERFEVPFILDSKKKSCYPNQEIVSFESGRHFFSNFKNDGFVNIYHVKIKTKGVRKDRTETEWCLAAKRSPPYPDFPPGFVVTYTQNWNGTWFDNFGNQLTDTPIKPTTSPVGMRVLQCSLYPGTLVLHKIKIKWFHDVPNDYEKITYVHRTASPKKTSRFIDRAQKGLVASAPDDKPSQGNESIDDTVSSPPKKKAAVSLPSPKSNTTQEEVAPTSPRNNSTEQSHTDQSASNTYRVDQFYRLPSDQWFHEDGFEVETPFLLRGEEDTNPGQRIESIGVANTPSGREWVTSLEVRTEGINKSAPCPAAIKIPSSPSSPSDRCLTFTQQESGGWIDGDGRRTMTPEWLYNQSGWRVKHFSVYPGTTKVRKIIAQRIDNDDGSDEGIISRMYLDGNGDSENTEEDLPDSDHHDSPPADVATIYYLNGGPA